jgi:hypothetical protein
LRTNLFDNPTLNRYGMQPGQVVIFHNAVQKLSRNTVLNYETETREMLQADEAKTFLNKKQRLEETLYHERFDNDLDFFNRCRVNLTNFVQSYQCKIVD